MIRPFLVFLIGMIATAVMAQSDTYGNLYVGYSFLSNDVSVSSAIGFTSTGRANMNGWNAAAEVKLFRWLGGVADFNGSYGSVPVECDVFSPHNPGICPPVSTVNTHFYTYLFGPRLSVSLGRVRPFAEVLVGLASQSLQPPTFSPTNDSHVATAVGGGLDYRLTGRLGWRVQADYLNTTLFKHTQHDIRATTGIVFRF